MITQCRVCGAETGTVGTLLGKYHRQEFTLNKCDECGLAFIVDPWLDYAEIYDDRYYAGEGADPLADYTSELEAPEKTIRRYEWNGIEVVVRTLMQGRDNLRWMDYGCGAGGLVRFLGSDSSHEAVGFEPSPYAARLESHGIPLIEAEGLDEYVGTFDVVTAIEVVEHLLDPVAELRRMRALLKPGGLLFLTTGNAEPHAEKLLTWSYVIPEIHLSYFEPRTLEYAYRLAGFEPERRGYVRGFDDILKFKVLKNLHLRQRSSITDLLPAWPISRIGDRIARVSDQPIGWAR